VLCGSGLGSARTRPARSSCRDGWVDSPWGCYFSPPLLTTHDHCASLCRSSASGEEEEVHAALTCSSRPEELAYLVQEFVKPTSDHWLGWYEQAPGKWKCVREAKRFLGKARGEDACPAPPWAPDEPHNATGRGACAILRTDGRWHSTNCMNEEMRCLCRAGSLTSAAYASFVAAEAQRSDDGLPISWGALAILSAIMWLPMLVVLVTVAASQVESRLSARRLSPPLSSPSADRKGDDEVQRHLLQGGRVFHRLYAAATLLPSSSRPHPDRHTASPRLSPRARASTVALTCRSTCPACG
jgi:hypothetical protein